jgi:hypothetical protein
MGSLLKTNLLSMWPIDMQIDILGPLLPLNEAYAELASTLATHPSYSFASLSHFVNIVPNCPSSQWCAFATQCLKRGYVPSYDSCKLILEMDRGEQ